MSVSGPGPGTGHARPAARRSFGRARSATRALRRRVHARLVAPLWRLFIGGLGATLRYEIEGEHHLRDARGLSPSGRVVGCFWHGRTLPLIYLWRGRGVWTFVSRSPAGDVQARALARMGYRSIRGASSRGGSAALLKMLRGAGLADIGVAADGSRGPHERFSAGVVYLAARSGLPLLFLGISPRRCWRLPTWDHFRVPKPFSRVRIVYGPALLVPSGARREELERFRVAAERALEEANTQAERWAAQPANRPLGRGSAE